MKWIIAALGGAVAWLFTPALRKNEIRDEWHKRAPHLYPGSKK